MKIALSRRPVLAALSALALLPAAAADAQLMSQRIEGTRRICEYDRGTARPGAAPSVEREVGLGEPCPWRDPGAPRESRSDIPPFAQLEGQRRSGDDLLCEYRYLGQLYTRRIPERQHCPLTPHFFKGPSAVPPAGD